MKILAVAAVAASVFLAAVSAPAATVPCWRTVILDWGDDGRIEQSYPPKCYRQALRHLDTDLQIYSSARDEIERALAASMLVTKPPRGGSRGGRLARWPEGRRFPDVRPPVQTPLGPTLTDRLDLL